MPSAPTSSSSAVTSAALPPETRFRVIRDIGEGSSGTVHVVVDRQTSAQYVMKRIRIGDDPGEEQRVLAEIRAMMRIDHPNIVRFKTSFMVGDTTCIVMEKCEGSLAHIIEQAREAKQVVAEPVLLEWMTELLCAVAQLHQQGIMHRDIKPANVFLSKRNHVKLGDFGVCKHATGGSGARYASSVVGTPYYIAPEVLDGSAYDARSDVWSLGVLLYELCSLRLPFDGENFLAVVNAVTTGEFAPLPERLDRRFEEVIRLMLQVDPEKRASATDILERYIRLSTSHPSHPGQSAHDGRAIQRDFGAAAIFVPDPSVVASAAAKASAAAPSGAGAARNSKPTVAAASPKNGAAAVSGPSRSAAPVSAGSPKFARRGGGPPESHSGAVPPWVPAAKKPGSPITSDKLQAAAMPAEQDELVLATVVSTATEEEDADAGASGGLAADFSPDSSVSGPNGDSPPAGARPLERSSPRPARRRLRPGDKTAHKALRKTPGSPPTVQPAAASPWDRLAKRPPRAGAGADRAPPPANAAANSSPSNVPRDMRRGSPVPVNGIAPAAPAAAGGPPPAGARATPVPTSGNSGSGAAMSSNAASRSLLFSPTGATKAMTPEEHSASLSRIRNAKSKIDIAALRRQMREKSQAQPDAADTSVFLPSSVSPPRAADDEHADESATAECIVVAASAPHRADPVANGVRPAQHGALASRQRHADPTALPESASGLRSRAEEDGRSSTFGALASAAAPSTASSGVRQSTPTDAVRSGGATAASAFEAELSGPPRAGTSPRSPGRGGRGSSTPPSTPKRVAKQTSPSAAAGSKAVSAAAAAMPPPVAVAVRALLAEYSAGITLDDMDDVLEAVRAFKVERFGMC